MTPTSPFTDGIAVSLPTEVASDLDIVAPKQTHDDLVGSEVVVLSQVDDRANYLGAGDIGAVARTTRPARWCWEARQKIAKCGTPGRCAEDIDRGSRWLRGET